MGWKLWHSMKRKYHINYEKVIIIMSEDDDEWNRMALLHLPDYMERKNVREAVIFLTENIDRDSIKRLAGENVELATISKECVWYLNKYYCLYRFFDNIVFLSLDMPKDNNGREILGNGVISKEELICLGFYFLRRVPNIKPR